MTRTAFPIRRVPWLTDLDAWRETGPLQLRPFVAFVLVYGTQDNHFDADRIREFQGFPAQHDFLVPQGSAYFLFRGAGPLGPDEWLLSRLRRG